jgi:hypothetical protein
MLYRLITPSIEEMEQVAGLATAIAGASARGREAHLTSARGTDLTR